MDLLRGAADAAAVHGDIVTGWAELRDDERPALLPYFGRGHRTLSRAGVDGGRLRVAKVDPEWRPNVGWYGDGTVPALSAIPGELSGRPEQAQAVPDKHGPMGTTAAVVEKLVTLQGEDIPVRGTDRPPMRWIGWDVDDTIPAGQETVVGAELHHGAAEPVEGAGQRGNRAGHRRRCPDAAADDPRHAGVAGDAAAAGRGCLPARHRGQGCLARDARCSPRPRWPCSTRPPTRTGSDLGL